ncbi:4'-phosphopantetheinyl transferase family protein [Xiashengella succiniciproducens]|jgi:4'-phosphopantetheinyl transferase|uniref:4'-phosphopantetheinyl transferase superfamily protein n=1 Tax=Xiashengella succiniciproducens TaxID=2949635 RepID=A0A9J6ZR71_9BACT|nr:4'-phosphopantetheinyl transferase superfamily protein [Alkaliflexus sp. Ai-910]MDI9539505.1 4'-phosphopantetheinyl transferase superfamily protein [Bacteroidota bacterium]URW80157.1 4'-phosphopantetheinyl transferase superfamily protein [Alkaliflexus sp. Ai-910]HHU01001.1 4'-phosphopantetheinyl transferase superfamily protein [Bacteroidales bacterium]
MPVIFRKEGTDGALLAVWKITEPEEELISRLRLTDSMERRLSMITHPVRRREWIASRLLIQELNGATAEIVHAEDGRPTLASMDLHVSITHTRGYAGVLLSPKGPIGIDIEYPSERLVKLSDRFVNDFEAAQMNGINKQTGCALIWCSKEAVFKALDQPGLLFKEEVEVEGLSGMPEGMLKARVKRDNFETKLDLNYIVSPDYYLVWSW